jgi:hypothetical protein
MPTNHFVDLGEPVLKNIARPIRVYAVKSTDGLPLLSTRAAQQKLDAPRLSIVVLPLANLGGDKEQDYFADSITETLTTDLSRIPGAFVISHGTALTFKGRVSDAKQLGRELGVRYVLGVVYRATAVASASMLTSWMRRPALISGLSGLTSHALIYSTCRMR